MDAARSQPGEESVERQQFLHDALQRQTPPGGGAGDTPARPTVYQLPEVVLCSVAQRFRYRSEPDRGQTAVLLEGTVADVPPVVAESG